MLRTKLSFCACLSAALLAGETARLSSAEDTIRILTQEANPAAPENATPEKVQDKPDEKPAAETPPAQVADPAEPNDGTDAAPADGTEVTPSEAANSPDKVPEAQAQPGDDGAPTSQPSAKDNPKTDPAPPSTEKSADESAPLSPEDEKLRSKVRQALLLHFNEPITTNDYSPWGTMHALIAYGVDTEIFAGGKKVNAIGWLCYNGPCRGMQLLYVEKGKLRVRIGPGVQGHPGQFLAMLAQSKVKPDFPIKVDGREFTVADLIESEKETCRAKTELTFKLIALSHYLKTTDTWKSDIGEEWSIPRLIKEELAQPIVGAACGGTHRMGGFSYAVNKRTRMEEEFDGQWLRAQKFVNDYHNYLFKLQNDDGSFSTSWFAGRGDYGEAPRRLETTGHMLEWLVASLPKDQLDDPRVVKAVDYLAELFIKGNRQGRKWEIGPRGHALHALALYNERRFGDQPGKRDEILAKKKSAPKTDESTTTR